MSSQSQPATAPGYVSFVMEVTLRDVEPPVRRRFEVAGDVNMWELHRILQLGFGWGDEHLHEFRKGDIRYGDPDLAYGYDVLVEEDVCLDQVVSRVGDTIEYWYDFGDDWFHDLKVVERLASEKLPPMARLIDGEGECPPEDCGGPFGYMRLCEALKAHKEGGGAEDLDMDPDEFAGLVHWCSGFEPDGFALEARQAAVARFAQGPIWHHSKAGRAGFMAGYAALPAPLRPDVWTLALFGGRRDLTRLGEKAIGKVLRAADKEQESITKSFVDLMMDFQDLANAEESGSPIDDAAFKKRCNEVIPTTWSIEERQEWVEGFLGALDVGEEEGLDLDGGSNGDIVDTCWDSLQLFASQRDGSSLRYLDEVPSDLDSWLAKTADKLGVIVCSLIACLIDSERNKPVRRQGKKVGRNEPCPCGSGKKYKRCCL